MKFWDTSAVVPLLVAEAGTRAMGQLLRDDPEMIVWWGTRVECASALARYDREQGFGAAHLVRAGARLAALATRWSEIVPTESLRSTAERLVRTHPLRAADALQLAAAWAASDGQPDQLAFVSLDVRQREAARREGFGVLPEAMPSPGMVRERPARRARSRSAR
ncbi:MAG TPA: type II toxin-antitoxin system VapC family toxin [Gemmatimonadaceae bacterium]|nr:type II toxin-antitoxin system VapC family toxin [Gemmatimonadaceae bacterium]